MTAPALAEALARAARALDCDDAVAASGALTDAVRACEAALRRGLRLDPPELSTLGGLHARCAAAAERARDRLRRSLAAAATGRRAADAYRR